MPHPGGRPTKYDPIYVQKAREYLEDKTARDDVPWIEEFARSIGTVRQNLHNWSKEHQEFFDAINEIEEFQRVQLMKKAVNGEAVPAPAIFLLKANHGMIETEKRILAGDKENPLIPTPIIDLPAK